MFRLKIATDNDIFEIDQPGEVARILRDLAEKLDELNTHDGEGTLRDLNGNTVGSWELS